MAIIKCPECNREISDQAEKCPHCGYPLKMENDTNRSQNSVLGIVFGTIFSVLSIVLFLLFALLPNLTSLGKKLFLIFAIVSLIASILEFLIASAQSKK